MPVKTDKANLLHSLEASVEPVTRPTDEPIAYVYDVNATLQSLVSIPESFEGPAEMVLNLLPNTSRVDFVTDTYKRASIKSLERKRRGTAPTHLLSGAKTKTPRDWKSFMTNDENKPQLIILLFDEWQKDTYAKKIHGREIYFAISEKCYCLTSTNAETVTETEVDALSTSQEEAGTRIILHCLHISQTAPTTTHIVV